MQDRYSEEHRSNIPIFRSGIQAYRRRECVYINLIACVIISFSVQLANVNSRLDLLFFYWVMRPTSGLVGSAKQKSPGGAFLRAVSPKVRANGAEMRKATVCDTRRRPARSDNPKVTRFKSRLRNQHCEPKKISVRKSPKP